jgi:hypothetical protein
LGDWEVFGWEAKNMELIEEMEKHLPIPAYASRELYQLLRDQGKNINLNTKLKVTKVFDSGDMGGIMCSVIEEDSEVYVVSLTHLRIKRGHPLHRKISAYQKKRIRRLSRQDHLI